MLFIHGHEKRREHHEDHADRRGAGVEFGFQQEKQRDTDHSGDSKADKLPFGQVQNYFCFHCGQVLGDRNISQKIT